ncbi:unnamed protein product [Rhizophagus irregularis]|nr:unnamed protein product [Rhizophagus irregularis]
MLGFFEIGVNTSRLTIEELKQKLKDYNINTTDVNNRVILAGILQNRLDNETLEQNKDTSNTETASTDLGSKQVSACTLDFSLPSGWALKERQKFAQEMYNELKELVEEGILEAEEIPKVSTIGNWITRYAQAHRKVQAQQALAQVNDVLKALKI